MRIFRVVLPVLAVLLPAFSTSALALDLSGQSRTYLESRQEADSTRLLPLFEYLDFDAQDLGSKNLSFHFGGWGRYDLRNESFGSVSTGDLQYAYMSYRAEKANTFMNLGRVVVNQGVANAQVDGVSAGTDLAAGFGISAFGGVPVETAFDSRTDDSVYGGRINHEVSGLYNIGFSYLKERNNSEDFRKEEGLDLWFRPWDKTELQGATLYNTITRNVARNAYNLILGPFSFLTLRTDYTAIRYADYFTSTTLNAFTFQPGGPIDPNERLKSYGEEAVLTFGKIALSGDYKKYRYEIAGDATYSGGKLAFNYEPGTGAGAAVHRMHGDTTNLQYDEYRAFAFKKFEKFDIALDLLDVSYDAAINGVSKAYSASLSGGFAITPALKVGADVEYSKNPFFDKDVRGMVQLVYNFDFAPGGQGRK